MDRIERRARIRSLSAIALRLFRVRGQRGRIDYRGGSARCYDLANDELRISHLRWDDGRGNLEVFHLGAKVLLVEWTADKVIRTSFKPGNWERDLMRYDRLSDRVPRRG